MKKPQAINLFIDDLNELELLSDAQTGRLIKALLRYAGKGEKPDFSDDHSAMMLFSFISRRIDRDFIRYAEICEKRREAGRRGGAPKGNTNAAKTSKTNKTSQTETESESESETESETKTDSARAAVEGRDDPLKYIIEIEEIIHYLNRQTGKSFRSGAKSTRRLITDLLDEGYRLDDIKRAIANMCAQWKGTEYEKYLRPETLFGAKFDSYLNMPPVKSKPKGGSVYDAEAYLNSISHKLKPLFDD